MRGGGHQASGIPKASLPRFEAGNLANPTVDTLLRYAAVVGCRLSWRVEGTAGRSGKGGRG
jgi:hypothetical protein